MSQWCSSIGRPASFHTLKPPSRLAMSSYPRVFKAGCERASCIRPAVHDHPADRIELGLKSRAGGIGDELSRPLGTCTAPGTLAADQPSATSQSAARNPDALPELPRKDRTRPTALRQAQLVPARTPAKHRAPYVPRSRSSRSLRANDVALLLAHSAPCAGAGMSEDRNVPRARAFRDAHRPRRGARRRGSAGLARVPAARGEVANGVAARAGCSRLSIGSVARALDAAPHVPQRESDGRPSGRSRLLHPLTAVAVFGSLNHARQPAAVLLAARSVALVQTASAP